MPSSGAWRSFDAHELSGVDRYKYLIGGIVPRPIAVVGTRSPDGRDNLAPFSFFSGVGSVPWSLLVCPASKDAPGGPDKDTLRNAKPTADGGTGVFSVSVASRAIVRRVVAAGEGLEFGASEFEAVGLTPTPCDLIAAPRVAESPITFECRTTHVIRLAPGQPAGGNILVGEVIRVHAHESVWQENHRVDAAALDAIGRMGGLTYCGTRERFDLPPGLAALTAHHPD